MKTVNNDAENQLFTMTKSLMDKSSGYYAVQFNLSKLGRTYKNPYQLKVATNIVAETFRSIEGGIYVCADYDMFLIYKGNKSELLEKLIFQLRYLLMNTRLAYNKDKTENKEFYNFFDLTFQFETFVKVCQDKIHVRTKHARERNAKESIITRDSNAEEDHNFTPYHLSHLEQDLQNLDLSRMIRQQPAYAIVKDKMVRPVFEEIYINIAHLRKNMMPNVDLLSNKNLFRYLTEVLDRQVLKILMNSPLSYFGKSISLNLNISTLLSEFFLDFDKATKAYRKSSVIIEIDIADVFSNMSSYIMAKSAVQSLGYRLCIDNIDCITFSQLNRSFLGNPLAKIRWNSDKTSNELREAITQWGANRIILCRCDNQEALDFGKSLGISLFQGRIVDHRLDPYSKIIN